MTGYNGRRAPNFSQYLSELNTIPSPYDQSLQQQDLFDVDAELAMFTNAEFLHFDGMGDLQGDNDVKLETGDESGKNTTQVDSTTGNAGQDLKYMDMLNDFNIPNYPEYSAPMLSNYTSGYPAPHPPATGHNGSTLGASDLSHQTISHVSPTVRSQPAQPAQSAGTKRKQEAVTGSAAQSVDEEARLAQEEDKRRRNTAASARFRIKKKEREKNMERTVKDVTAKNATLEARVTQLEMENRWLKNLITEKNGSGIADGDISGMFKKFQESNQQSASATQKS